MQPPKSDLCVLCGSRPATTRDHVPPKGLFKGLGAQLITVPACSICNNSASSDDEDLRFFVSAQVGKQTPGSAALWDEGAYPSINRKTALRASVIANARDVRATDANGDPITRLAFLAPVRTYQTVFERTTRGLYFFHNGRILPPNTPVVVQLLEGSPNLATAEFGSFEQHSIGDEACVYRFGVILEQPENSLWLYCFYKTHWVMVVTGEAAEK